MSGFRNGVTNRLATPAIIANALANRPASAAIGTLFIGTEANPVFQRWNGTTWINITPGSGGVPSTRTLTIAGVAQDLSADRTWLALAPGGNTYGINFKIGTDDNFTVAIKTNNIDRLTFDTAGNALFSTAIINLTAGANTTIGNTDNFALRLKTNNITRLSIANNGRTSLFSDAAIEDGVNINTLGQTNKLFIGVTTGSISPANQPFITAGTSLVTTTPRIQWVGAELFFLASPAYEFSATSPATTSTVFRTGLTGTAAGPSLTIVTRADSSGGGHNPTSGDMIILRAGNGSLNMQFNPTSGTARFMGFQSMVTINQTGTANGDTFGFRTSQTLTSVLGNYSAFGTAVDAASNVYAFRSTGTAQSFFGGTIETAATIKTAQPSANGAGLWKLGKLLAGAVTPDATQSIEVEIDGVIRKIIIAA